MHRTLSQPSRTSSFGPVTTHGTSSRRRRRRRWVAFVVVAVLVAAVATVSLVIARRHGADARRHYISTSGWPAAGQGAYQVGDLTPAASPSERPVPIASLAKVMTALIVLKHHPLDDGSDGPTLVVTDADVADTRSRARRDESLIPVSAGEQLSERQALLALLLPSANNVAAMLARFVDGSVDAFVAEMNRTARALHMRDTTYTDPSGFDPGTVSTAVDQLELALKAADNATLMELMGQTSARLPVAGTVRNTDTLLGHDGFVGMKTGSDDAAGGCFMFESYRSVEGVNTPLIGVVLAQPGDNLIQAGLNAAKQLVDRVAPTPAHP